MAKKNLALLLIIAILSIAFGCKQRGYRDWLDNLYSDRTIDENSQYVFLSEYPFGSILRFDKETQEICVFVSDCEAESLLLLDDRLYFVDGGRRICHADIKSGAVTTNFENGDAVHNLLIPYNGDVYFETEDSGGNTELCRLEEGGAHPTGFTEPLRRGRLVAYTGGWIYYHDRDGGTSRVRPDGSGAEKVADTSRFFSASSQDGYYYGTEDGLFFSGGNGDPVPLESRILWDDGEYIYYSSDNILRRQNASGNTEDILLLKSGLGIPSLTADVSPELLFADGWLFFWSTNGKLTGEQYCAGLQSFSDSAVFYLYAVRSDGTELIQLWSSSMQ